MVGFAALVVLIAQVAQAQTVNPLKFFKNYFITGGYAVGGVGLADQGQSGIATGEITISGVPAGAEILAAFMYAQIVSDAGGNAAGAGVTFNGVPLSISSGTFGVIGDPDGATPCWSGGGGTGSGQGAKKTYSLRYDVLRMLPKGPGGQAQGNGTYTVQLPDQGNASSPIALGASLVLFYRVPTDPLSAFVIYDGSAAMDNSTHGIFQEIKGFYDPAAVPGKLTHIVGSAGIKSEQLLVNGSSAGLTNGGVNLFTSAQGNAWDNVTVTTPTPTNGVLTTSVTDQGIPNADCVTWSAIIYQTRVNDPDGDGLLSAWETNTGALQDPNGQPLPPLGSMGADPNHKDLFLEIGYMYTDSATSNASGGDKQKGLLYGGVLQKHHQHLLSPAALTKVYNAFNSAPVANPSGNPGIKVHFDIGPPAAWPQGVSYATVPGVIPAPNARGGESLDEMSTVCPPVQNQPTVCQFYAHPGTLGWKTAFRTVRDALKSIPPSNLNIDCTLPGNDGPGQHCERVFDRNRKDIFRYFFMPHLLAVPKAHCLNLTGTPATNPNYGLPDESCQNSNPLFRTPNTYTGIADFGGADGMVSMGGFLNASGEPVGTEDQQAATLMHELGHTLMLAHGGFKGNANCNPNYLSIMNYLFQLRLLITADGQKAINYSAQALNPLDESALAETLGIGSPNPEYLTAWYQPYANVGTAATRHCDSSPMTGGPSMIRVDQTVTQATPIGGVIDWNGDGQIANGNVTGDINYNGVTNTGSASLSGFNDWAAIRLNQVGARRNIGVWFFTDDDLTDPGFEIHIGPASLGMTQGDFGEWDFGEWDFGEWDFGEWDFGEWDFGSPSALNYGDLNLGDLGRSTGEWDFGEWDFGEWDFGEWDFGEWDFGEWDFGAGAGDIGRGDGQGDFGRAFGQGQAGGPVGEVTAGLAVGAGLFRGPILAACVADGQGTPPCSGTVTGRGRRVQLTWTAADAPPVSYVVYRRTAAQTQFTALGQPLSATTLVFVDTTVSPNITYFYYVAARYTADGETNERPSNIASVTTKN